MKNIIRFCVIAATIGTAHQVESTTTVTPKVILELQPQSHELDDMFADATVNEMTNRQFTHLANLKANAIGGVTMETLGSWLETSGYGVLLYGAHGAASGETGGETFATSDAANTKRQWLIDNQYFTADELGPYIWQNPAKTYFMLMFTTQYTNSKPAGSAVAVISSCT